MFLQIGRLEATLGLLGLALAGCTTNPEVQDQGTGIALRSAIGNTCVEQGDSLVFAIDITGAGETLIDPIHIDDVTLTQVFDAADLDLGGDPDLTGIWVGGDRFIALPPGDYDVTATASGTSVTLLPGDSQTQVVHVDDGETAETTFAFQCEGQTLSALDVVVLVSEGPSIIGWEYSDDKFGMICEDVSMTATFSDLQGGPLHVTYEMFADPQSGYSGPGTASVAPVASKAFDGVAPVGGGDFPVTWTYAHSGPPGTYYVYVTVTNSAQPPQSTTFQALFHAYEAIGGNCSIENSSWTTGDYALIVNPTPIAPHVPGALSYTPPDVGTPVVVDSLSLTLEGATLEFYDYPGITPPLKTVRIKPDPNAPSVWDSGTQANRPIAGYQTLSYGSSEAELDIAFLNSTQNSPLGYELYWNAANGRYQYSGYIQYRIYDSAGVPQGTGRVGNNPWLASDGHGGWVLTGTQWRVISNYTTTLTGDSITAVGASAKLAIEAPDAFGLNGSDSCDGTVDLNDACMAALDLPACEQDCSTPPPPPSGEACTDPVKPENTIVNEETQVRLPVPMPSYPTECSIYVNADGYVQGGGVGGVGPDLGLPIFWCDANNVLFLDSSGAGAGACAVPPVTPACYDGGAPGFGAPGCAWQN